MKLVLFAVLAKSQSVLALQKSICGLKTETFTCSSGQVISITKVFYGRVPPIDIKFCNQYQSHIPSNTSCVGDPTASSYVTNLCDNKQTCSVTNDWTQLGKDPCNGIPKYLQIDYQCVSKTTTQRTTSTQTTSSTTSSTTSPTTHMTTPTTRQTTPTSIKTTPTSTTRLTTLSTTAKTTSSSGLSKVVCPGSQERLRCSPGFEIVIDFVQYGRTNVNPCNPSHAPIANLNCVSSQKSRSTVEMYCNHQSACIVKADSSWLGEDPCPGTPKYLQVRYHCVSLAPLPSTQSTTSTSTTRPTSTSTTSTISTTSTSTSTSTSTTTTTTTTTTTPTTTTTTTTPTSTSTTTTPTTTTTTRRTTPTSTATSTSTTLSTTRTTPTTMFPTYIPFNIPGVLPAGSQACHEYLISGPHGVPDSHLTASSQWNSHLPNDNNGPERSRLFTPAHDYGNGTYARGAWSAAYNDKYQYIQVELSRPSLIRGIVTQGRHVNPLSLCCVQRVTQYKVSWSRDGIKWNSVKDRQGNDKVFTGNNDDDSLVTHMLECPIIARFIRILPQSWTNHIALRFDVIGCQAVTDAAGKCPRGWVERPGSGSCYLFTSGTDSLSWDKARRSCQLQQGHLVDIQTVQEKDFILQEIRKHPQVGMWWVGLSNKPRKDNRDFKWTDGKPLDTRVLPWKQGQPDNGGYGEHCAEFWNQELNDDNCDNKRHYICEREKNWSAPVNKPALHTVTPPTLPTVVTTRTTTGTTRSTPTPTYSRPTTVPVYLPTRPGVTVVTNQHNVFTTGCVQSFADCLSRQQGDYPYCQGCGYYITCASSGVWVRPCPGRLKFDDNTKTCDYRSSTCKGP